MSLIDNLRSWWQDQTGEEDTPFDGDSFAFITSMIVHMCLLLALGLGSFAAKEKPAQVKVEAPIQDEELKQDEMKVPEEFYFSDIPSVEVGANSEGGEGVALSAGQIISEVSMVATGGVANVVAGPGTANIGTEFGSIEINNLVATSSGRTFSTMPVKGAAGEGTTGASGAVDRITYEILQQLEQRKTLVVWLFDQSPSMLRQRKEVKERFDRVYRELGVIEASGNKAFSKHDDSPLLTSLISFGDKVKLHTEKPVKDVEEIKAIVDDIPLDNTGNEKTFAAVYMAADLYKNLRSPDRETGQPKRNVMIILFTDEIGDDRETGLEPTIKICRQFEIPVYVVGVPAPFGRKETLVKWVDPDPKYDQSPQWGKVNQGPETFLPERVNLSFAGWDEDKEPLDSGFGPYSLTRLAYETGGIYFAVHPNRNVNRTVSKNETEAFSAHISHFFDPEVMRRYKPEYVSGDEYLRRAKGNKARAVLIQASQATEIAPPDKLDMRFVKRSEADLANHLSRAQESVAKLEPKLRMLYELMKSGEADRAKEFTPRWQAGYDLAMGRVMATMVRTEAYNQMLAKAKRGMKFEEEKNNTWILEHSDDLKEIGTQLEGAGKKAREYLERVVTEHPNTPWAFLAKKELETTLGYRWREEFTDLAPRNMGGGGGNNNNNNAPANDVKKMIQKGPPKREVPKL